MKNKKLLLAPVILAISLICVAAYFILSPVAGVADAVRSGFSKPVRDFFGTVWSVFPFSVMELLYVLAGGGLIFFIVRSVIAVKRSGKKLRTLARRALALLTAVSLIFCAFLWLWAIDYRAASFAKRAGLDGGPVDTERLYAVTKEFILKASALADTVPRDENGLFAETPDDFFPRCTTVYDALKAEFPVLEGECRVPKKMLFSFVMSATGFTGVYFPLTGESNINVDAPKAVMPATVAHELAHQLGVTSEQECNFLAILACISSDDPTYVYSGYLFGAIHLMNALNKADRARFIELIPLISDSMYNDMNEESEYWERKHTPVTDVSSKVYDTYLKANGDELGIRSYGACVNLLVNYFAPVQ